MRSIKIILTFVMLLFSEYVFAFAGGGVHIPTWLVLPFVILLLMIATGPLFYAHFWHKNYPKVSIAFALVVMLYYVFVLHDTNGPIHAIIEYVPFISFLGALYIASGGIAINVNKKGSPIANVMLLAFGGIIANIIGTTGASMLLIRPFIKMNGKNIKAYHIVFFIFIVSNVGGSLTPIGDPPLFLGFLKGVPFFWTLTHNFMPYLFAVTLLIIMFYFIDKRDATKREDDDIVDSMGEGPVICISGSKNFLWLALTVCAVFFDPNVFEFLPSIPYHGQKVSFVKEIIWILVCIFSYKMANKKAHELNNFDFEPIKEVAFLFIGIFGTMTPALGLVSQVAQESGSELITTNVLYFGTGILSGFLDNAPTYVTFLTAAMATDGLNITVAEQVTKFAADFPFKLEAVSIAAVFFGALTYIGNGPNFMVKSIAEHSKISMPSFFGYIVKFSLPFLSIVLILTWVVFFSGYVIPV